MWADRALSKKQLDEFRACHRLPPSFEHVAESYYLPLARRLPKSKPDSGPLLLGINGAQGTGKSTLADFLRLACESLFKWNVAVLSIDDFYYTKDERTTLAENVHPLLRTRGVPGTHDTNMLTKCIDQLRLAKRDEGVSLPRFDKVTDDRARASVWPVVSGPVDFIILEGWCVASEPQTEADLQEPVNALERIDDSDGVWRHYANDQLGRYYAAIFDQLDLLIFLKAPGFDAIRRWRLQQEQQLPEAPGAESTSLMDPSGISRFIQHYERLTRENLRVLPNKADVVFVLNESHNIVNCESRDVL